MSASNFVTGSALEGYVPHRGINMLIDGFRMGERDGQAVGETRLTVKPDDSSGRGIFAASGEDGPKILEPALAEYLALGAICVLSPEMEKGSIAFFSVISSFELHREAKAGEVLTGVVKRLRDKARFRRFEGEVVGEDGSPVANADVMAYAAEVTASDSDKRESTRLLKPPQVGQARPIDRSAFGWKKPEMVFIDEVVNASDDLTDATFRYTYPADHPFCPGHFPGNPVMMGITQWIAASDAAAWLVLERARAGIEASADSWQADVEIVRESGSPVTEIKQMSLRTSSEGSTVTPVRITRTRRVGFRDQVRPGEVVFVRARIEPDGR